MSAKILLLVIATSFAVVSPMVAQAAEPVTVAPGVAQVVKMHVQGVAPDVLLAYVRVTPIVKPSADEVLYLTEKGIPKEVIVAMLSKKVWSDTPAPQSQPPPAQSQGQLPPAVSNAQPATQTVVQQAPSTVTYVSPAPVYAAPYYYSPYYYNPWPAFSVGVGLGYGWGHWGHSHWGGHGGGIHVHHR